MATTGNTVNLKGKLQLRVEGHEQPIELGDIELPMRIEFTRPGGITRGGISGGATINIPAPPSGPNADQLAAAYAAASRSAVNHR